MHLGLALEITWALKISDFHNRKSNRTYNHLNSESLFYYKASLLSFSHLHSNFQLTPNILYNMYKCASCNEMYRNRGILTFIQWSDNYSLGHSISTRIFIDENSVRSHQLLTDWSEPWLRERHIHEPIFRPNKLTSFVFRLSRVFQSVIHNLHEAAAWGLLQPRIPRSVWLNSRGQFRSIWCARVPRGQTVSVHLYMSFA